MTISSTGIPDGSTSWSQFFENISAALATATPMQSLKALLPVAPPFPAGT